VGRTARNQKKGKSLLFLLPSEQEFLVDIKSAKIEIKKVNALASKLQSASAQFPPLLVKKKSILSLF